MTVTLNKGADEKTIAKLWERLRMAKKKKSGVDTRKYCGIIKLQEDPNEIQKRMRNEWGD